MTENNATSFLRAFSYYFLYLVREQLIYSSQSFIPEGSMRLGHKHVQKRQLYDKYILYNRTFLTLQDLCCGHWSFRLEQFSTFRLHSLPGCTSALADSVALRPGPVVKAGPHVSCVCNCVCGPVSTPGHSQPSTPTRWTFSFQYCLWWQLCLFLQTCCLSFEASLSSPTLF